MTLCEVPSCARDASTSNPSSGTPNPHSAKLQPKLKEIRRVYSSPEFSKKVLEKWHPRATIRIDLSAIRNAIVSEVEEEDEDSNATVVFERGKRGRRLSLKEFWGEWVREAEGEGSGGGDWEPIRALKSRFKDFEKCSSSSEIFDGFKNSEFLEKVKSSLVCFLLFPLFLQLQYC
ncbi:hypothetical protein AHAS_Ahas16G0171000 [Arachis hypogaea]